LSIIICSLIHSYHTIRNALPTTTLIFGTVTSIWHSFPSYTGMPHAFLNSQWKLWSGDSGPHYDITCNLVAS